MKTENETEAHLILNAELAAEIDDVRMFQNRGREMTANNEATKPPTMHIHAGIVGEHRLTDGERGAENVRNEFIANLQSTTGRIVNGRTMIESSHKRAKRN